MAIFKKIIAVLLISSTAMGAVSAAAQSAGLPTANDSFSVDLQSQIDAKSKQLDEINRQITDTRNNLDQIATQKQTLKNEVKKIDYSINQANLGIKSSQISIDKYELEIEQTNRKISAIGGSIALKRQAIGETLQMLMKHDKEGLLQTLLKNDSLSKGIFEIQALADLSSQLTIDVNELNNLQNNLNAALAESQTKKNRLEQENQTLKIRKDLAIQEKQNRGALLADTKAKEQLYEQQLTDLQKQQEDVANEIEKVESVLRGQIDATHIPPPRPGILASPVPGGVLTQGYGRTKFAILTYHSEWHNGVDIAEFLGAEIAASDDGTVVAMGNQDKYCPRAAYGKFIAIKHHNGLTTLYAHLSAQMVKIGEEVSRGQVIGLMGRTGWATGPHLHFTVFDSSTYKLGQSRTCGPMPYGGDINPGNYLPSVF